MLNSHQIHDLFRLFYKIFYANYACAFLQNANKCNVKACFSIQMRRIVHYND